MRHFPFHKTHSYILEKESIALHGSISYSEYINITPNWSVRAPCLNAWAKSDDDVDVDAVGDGECRLEKYFNFKWVDWVAPERKYRSRVEKKEPCDRGWMEKKYMDTKNSFRIKYIIMRCESSRGCGPKYTVLGEVREKNWKKEGIITNLPCSRVDLEPYFPAFAPYYYAFLPPHSRLLYTPSSANHFPRINNTKLKIQFPNKYTPILGVRFREFHTFSHKNISLNFLSLQILITHPPHRQTLIYSNILFNLESKKDTLT